MSNSRGIYIVANDLFANQLIALLNSFRKNWPNHYPICVIPYDTKAARIVEIVKRYENVSFFDDIKILTELEQFYTNLWNRCPSVLEAWKSRNKEIPHRLGMHRRFFAISKYGLFDQFMYLDTDIYVNQDMSFLFDYLEQYEIVAHDWQHLGIKHALNIEHPRTVELFGNNLSDKVQCAGLMVSKKELVSDLEWKHVQEALFEDHEVLYPWGPDQTLWNYLINKLNKRFVNLIRVLPKNERTHDAQTFTRFDFRDGKLYEEGREILYFHHIGVPADDFNRLVEGKPLSHNFRYQDVFLYFYNQGEKI